MVNINDCIMATVQMLEPSVHKRVEVVLNLGDIPPLPCYPALLNESFMNLLTNACQAIKGNGQVFVDTRREGDEIVISIRDTGSGIAPEHLEQDLRSGLYHQRCGGGGRFGSRGRLQCYQGTPGLNSGVQPAGARGPPLPSGCRSTRI